MRVIKGFGIGGLWDLGLNLVKIMVSGEIFIEEFWCRLVNDDDDIYSIDFFRVCFLKY